MVTRSDGCGEKLRRTEGGKEGKRSDAKWALPLDRIDKVAVIRPELEVIVIEDLECFQVYRLLCVQARTILLHGSCDVRMLASYFLPRLLRLLLPLLLLLFLRLLFLRLLFLPLRLFAGGGVEITSQSFVTPLVYP